MTALCIDTNVYSAYRKGVDEIVDIFKAASLVWVPAIVLGELRFGFVNGNRNASNELLLEKFLESPSVSVAVAGVPTSREYAFLSHELRVRGAPIPTNDIWIAACAIELNCPVLTFDAHFKRIDGLRVVSSKQDWIELHK